MARENQRIVNKSVMQREELSLPRCEQLWRHPWFLAHKFYAGAVVGFANSL